MTESALVQSIGSWLYDKKAKDIIALKVAHLTVITDYMVIASGRNVTQVKALADEVDEKMAEAGWILRRSEGGTEGRWIVVATRMMRDGLKQADIAQRIGMTCPTFSRRMKNPSQLTLGELRKLQTVLRLTDAEVARCI